jgi:hypothetical protein
VVSEMDSRTEALKEWIEIARQKVEEENLGRKPPARERSAVRDGSEDSAKIPEESPEPEEKERSPPEGKDRFSFLDRAPAVTSIRRKSQPSSPPDDDQSRPSSNESIPERTSRKKARGVAKLPYRNLCARVRKNPLPGKGRNKGRVGRGKQAKEETSTTTTQRPTLTIMSTGGDETNAVAIVPPNADRQAADPLAGTGGRGPGIGVHGSDKKMTTGTELGGRRWREEVMAGTHRVRPPLLIDPPTAQEKGRPQEEEQIIQ